MQEIKNGIDRTHLKCIHSNSYNRSGNSSFCSPSSNVYAVFVRIICTIDPANNSSDNSNGQIFLPVDINRYPEDDSFGSIHPSDETSPHIPN